MEYVFGTKGKMEILKTKGGGHTDLTGFRQIERIYPNETITDHFRVVRKLESKEDGEGNCYDWYEIDSHYRTVDKSAPLNQRIEENATAAENAICELDAGFDERLSAVENALCELDGLVNEGR